MGGEVVVQKFDNKRLFFGKFWLAYVIMIIE